MRPSHPFVVARLIAERIGTIKRHGTHIYQDQSKPFCDDPVSRTVWCRALKDALSVGHYVGIDIWVPCRKCDRCLAIRRLDWRDRMREEIKMASRTWFVTLTFKPKSREQLFKDGIDKHRAALLELTDYMKRLRSHLTQSWEQARLRFVAVTENHADGTPHIHMLVHSTDQLQARTFKKARWPHGFLDTRIVDAQVADYLVKYLTKEGSRVRASIHYGRRAMPDDSNELSSKQAKTQRATLGRTLTPETTPALMRRLVANAVFNGDVDASDGQAILSSILSLVPTPAVEPEGEVTAEVKTKGLDPAEAKSEAQLTERDDAECVERGEQRDKPRRKARAQSVSARRTRAAHSGAAAKAAPKPARANAGRTRRSGNP